MEENEGLENSLKQKFMFFSPAYSAGAFLIFSYLQNIIPLFTLVMLSIYGSLALFIGLIVQEKWPKRFQYLGRTVYHSVGGVIVVIAGIFYMRFNSLIVALSGVLFLFATGWVLEIIGVETMISKQRTAKHVKDFKKSTHYEAGTYWLLASIILLLFFPLNTAYASILILAIGDTSASFIGRNISKLKNPLNKNKTVEGSLAFFATSLFAAMLFFPTSTAIIAAFLLALVESLPLRINDNLTVPLSSGIILQILR